MEQQYNIKALRGSLSATFCIFSRQELSAVKFGVCDSTTVVRGMVRWLEILLIQCSIFSK